MSIITFLALIQGSFILFSFIAGDYESTLIMLGLFLLIFIPYLIFGGYKKIKKNILIFRMAKKAFKNNRHLPLSRVSELLGQVEHDLKNTNLFSVSNLMSETIEFENLQRYDNSFTGVFTEENSTSVYNIRYKEQLNKEEFKIVAHVVL